MAATTYYVRYASFRYLDEDHTNYITHGGMIVPWDDAQAPPTPNAEVSISVEAPGGEVFVLPSRVGQFVQSRGFMVTFEPIADRVLSELDRLVDDAEFRQQVEADRDPKPPEVGLLASTPMMDGSDGPTMPNANRPDFLEDPTDAIDQGLFGEMTDPQPEKEIEEEATQPEAPEVVAEGRGDSTFAHISETGEIERPGPGKSYFVYVVKYATVLDFGAIKDNFESSSRMRIPFEDEETHVGDIAQMRLTLPGRNVFNIWSVVEAVAGGIELRVNALDEVFRKACLYVATPGARSRLQNEKEEDRGPTSVIRIKEEMPTEDEEKMPIRRRLARMGMDDKINLALSGNREERMALAMDSNRAIHHYLLKNAKLTLDEIAFMSRLPSLNPDVLDKIAENPSYTQNPTVTKALVYNPRTPVMTAMRLLDRLPRNEVMNIAKRTGMNRRLVMAAKKKLERRRL